MGKLFSLFIPIFFVSFDIILFGKLSFLSGSLLIVSSFICFQCATQNILLPSHLFPSIYWNAFCGTQILVPLNIANQHISKPSHGSSQAGNGCPVQNICYGKVNFVLGVKYIRAIFSLNYSFVPSCCLTSLVLVWLKCILEEDKNQWVSLYGCMYDLYETSMCSWTK